MASTVPPETPSWTDQVTVVVVALATVAENCLVVEAVTVAVVGDTATVTEGVGEGDDEEDPPPPPPQAVRARTAPAANIHENRERTEDAIDPSRSEQGVYLTLSQYKQPVGCR